MAGGYTVIADRPSPQANQQGVESVDNEDEESDAEVITWDDICSVAKLDKGREKLYFDLFQEKYPIDTPAEGLMKVKPFLGEYMISEFSYRSFCQALGSFDSAKESEDEETEWRNHMSKNLTSDLVAAATTMLRLATTIANAHGLEMSDWADVNKVCGDAIRSVPRCYHLQYSLPGALNAARAAKHLTQDPDYLAASSDPWRSEEGQEAFERKYHVDWTDVAALATEDIEPRACFSAVCEIESVVHTELVAIVRLNIVTLLKQPSSPLPPKENCEGDTIMWEVETLVGNLLGAGLTIQADWYEIQSEVVFAHNFVAVAPAWM